MEYIGIGIILIIALLGVAYTFKSILRYISNENRYRICFKGSFKRHGLPIIKLKVLDDYQYFLLDTGASMSLLSTEYYNTIQHKEGIQVLGQSTINDSNNSFVSDVIMTSFSYKQNKFNNEEIYVSELSTLKKLQYKNKDIVGILGSPFFNKYRWAIDFDEMVVWIKKQK